MQKVISLLENGYWLENEVKMVRSNDHGNHLDQRGILAELSYKTIKSDTPRL